MYVNLVKGKRMEELKSIEKEEERLKEHIRQLESEVKGHGKAKAKGSIGGAITGKVKMKHIYAFAAFLVIALVIFAPITANMGTIAPGNGGDTYQNLWDIWWVGYATFTLHTSIWHTPLLFSPVGANLIFQTMAPIASLLSVPFQALGLPFAYNVLFFLGFALSGLTMFILVDYLAKNSYAAFFAGLVFSFSSEHIALALSHIDWMFVAWIPLAVYFFLKMARGEKPLLNGVGLGVAFVLVEFMGDVEQNIMLIELFVIMAIGYIAYKKTRKGIVNFRFAGAVGAFIVVAFVLGSWAYVPLANAIMQPGALSNINQINDFQHNTLWSDNLLSFFLPSTFNSVFHNVSLDYYYIFASGPTETVAYIGFVVLALAAYGIYKNFRDVRMWLIVAVIFGWLALGPYVQVGPANTGIPGLYYAYHSIPLLNLIREPGRFDVMAGMAIAVIAAFGVNAVLGRRSFSGRRVKAFVFIAIISAIFLVETNGIMGAAVKAFSTTAVQVPPSLYQIGKSGLNFSVLNIPALPNQYSPYQNLYNAKATFYTAITHKPLVGGYVTRENTTQQLSLFNIPLVIEAYNLQTSGLFLYQSPVLEDYTNQTLLTLYNYNTGLITVDMDAFNSSVGNALVNYMQSVFGNPFVDNSTAIFVTSPAINRTLFRSFVAYPILSEWGAQSSLVNGTLHTLWSPLNSGAVIVYAPYSNSTDIQQKMVSGYTEKVNTTIAFSAEAYPTPTTLHIESVDQRGNLNELGSFDINNTNGLREYSLNAGFYAGPAHPNTLLFITSNSSASYVLLENITFSK